MTHKTYPLSGAHCASCKILIEDITNEIPGLKEASFDLKKETLQFEANAGANFETELQTKLQEY